MDTAPHNLCGHTNHRVPPYRLVVRGRESRQRCGIHRSHLNFDLEIWVLAKPHYVDGDQHTYDILRMTWHFGGRLWFF